jgi:circadian clock protein KaiC
MLGGEGYYRGSSILVTGTAGTGKTSLGAHFVDATCRRGEKALYFAFEESPQQIVRNLRSIGIDLGRWIKKGLLHVEAARPSAFGLEMHLVRMHHLMGRIQPTVVVLDPISGLVPGGSHHDVTSVVLRIVDTMKSRGITALFTSLAENDDMQSTQFNISSLVDTWLLLRNIEVSGERNRVLYVLKSRGMAHSNQIREFTLTSRGVQLRDVYLGPSGVLTGSARIAREAEERREEMRMRLETRRRENATTAQLKSLEARIAALVAEKKSHEEELAQIMNADDARMKALEEDRAELSRSRHTVPTGGGGRSSRANGRGE